MRTLSSSLLSSSLRRYPARVLLVSSEGEGVKSLLLSVPELPEVTPGQFVMAWLPGYEEIPISPSLQDGSVLRLTIAAVGPTSRAFHRLSCGSRVFVRGPYGKGFALHGLKRPLLVAGGYGIAPLAYAVRHLLRNGAKPVIAVGGRTSKHVYLVDELASLGETEVYVYTEDGSAGKKGLVVDFLVEHDLGGFDGILACGPERMLYETYKIVKRKGVSVKVQFSVERIIKCGIGICGSCSLGSKLVCRDGPVFLLEELEKTEFGFWSRDFCGRIVPVDN